MYTNRNIWDVSYPIFLSLLAQNVINVTDTAFLGRVGEVELGASAMGGLYYICAFTIAFGFSTGSQIVIGRRNGEGRYDQIGPVNPAKRKAMAVKNEKRFLKQKRNALKNPGYSRHPVNKKASFKRLLKAV